MEYTQLAKLPQTSKKRLMRYAIASLALATILIPLLGLPAPEPGERSSPWRTIGAALWICAATVVLTSALVGGRISRAARFYILEKVAALPAMLILLFAGSWTLAEGLGSSFVAAFLPGLEVGVLALPLAITLRMRWMKEALATGHLSMSLDRESGTWDPRHDANHVTGEPLFRRTSCLLTLLFWGGPALGLALVDIFGHLTAAVIAGALATGFGYSLIMISVTDLVVLTVELRRLEKELGKPILLPADFTQGGRTQTG